MPPARLQLAVAAGGGVGAVLRLLIVQAGPALVLTLVINVVGSFLLGLLVSRRPSPEVRAVVGTGVLGGFTTTSALAVQTVTSSLPVAVAYLTATLVLGIAAARLGLTR